MACCAAMTVPGALASTGKTDGSTVMMLALTLAPVWAAIWSWAGSLQPPRPVSASSTAAAARLKNLS